MAIDLTQFHQVFFEESFEGLDIMESSLMELDPSAIDDETINAIFRSAHSIKGGSATFGFRSIAEFTHILETLLDQVRAGQRGLSAEDINLFLRSVDCMRELLEQLQAGEDSKTQLALDLESQFTQLLEGGSSEVVEETNATVKATPGSKSKPRTPKSQATIASAETGAKTHSKTNAKTSAKTSAKKSTTKRASKKVNVSDSDNSSSTDVTSVEDDGSIQHWKIEFLPTGEILKSGNDPYRLIRELSELGDISVKAHHKSFPSFAALDPEICYLSWDITLATSQPKASIEEIFEWVADESDIHIVNLDQEEESDLDDTDITWHIEFKPKTELLITGNDPVKLFSALEELGQYYVQAHFENLPGLADIQAENCYLWWDIYLESDEADKASIQEVFEWVLDEAEITINAVSGIFDPEAIQATSQNTSQNTPVNLSLVATNADKQGQEDATGSHEPKGKLKAKPMAQVPAGKPNTAKKATANTESSSIRVGIDKVDNLINMVGELVITQSMLGQLGTDFSMERIPKLLEGLSQLEQNTRELQESVMRIRMLPISFAFSRFPRMVRDLSQSLGKKVNLVMLGEQTELDKTVMEKIGDPLVHLVRNAVDHGIEMPQEREANGKHASGEITLNAYHQGGNVVIEIVDDGKGLDAEKLKAKALEKGLISAQDAEIMSAEQAYDLIFQPGFSTAQQVSDISGRGVGMDVVRRNIQALNGIVDISSEINVGSKIKIRLPLTLAILDGQLVRVGNCTYVFPLTSIVESLEGNQDLVNKLAGGVTVLRLRDDYVPIVKLAETFNQKADCDRLEDALLVVVESDNGKVAIVVDELLAQQQVVIKSLEQNYRRVDGISGATILGDGTVALILDIPGVVRLAEQEHQSQGHSTQNLFKHINERMTLGKRA